MQQLHCTLSVIMEEVKKENIELCPPENELLCISRLFKMQQIIGYI